MVYQASGLPLELLKDGILWLFASSCFSSQKCVTSWLSCHSKVWSFQRCAVMRVRCRAGPRIPFHTSVNAVWFYCHFLWWKLINPFPSPLPPNYVSSSQHGHWSVSAAGLTGPHLSQERWGVPGQPQVLHLSSGLFINLTAVSRCCILNRGLFFSFWYIFTEALPICWGACIFFKTRLEVVSATRGGGHYPLQFESFWKKNNTHWHTTHSTFDSRLIFQPLCKFYELSTKQTQYFKGLAVNVVRCLWSSVLMV